MSDPKPATPVAEPPVRVVATGEAEWIHDGQLVKPDAVVAVAPDVAARVIAAKAARKA